MTFAETIAVSNALMPIYPYRAHKIKNCHQPFPCKDALCPNCQGGYSRRANPYLNALPALCETLAGDRSLGVTFATLTQPLTPISDLRAGLHTMQNATQHFIRNLNRRADGELSSIRRIGISRRPGSRAHIHTHAFLIHPRGLINRQELTQHWRKSLQSETAHAHYSTVPTNDTGLFSLRLHYTLKPVVEWSPEMLNDAPFIRATAGALAGARTFESSGLFRQAKTKTSNNEWIN